MKYKEWLEDIEIAKNKIKDMKMYPDNIVADYYCIPSHNHQAYYVLLSNNNDGYSMTYIKPLIYTMKYEFPIKMYPFSRCEKAEKHPAQQGQFIIGTKKISNMFAERMLQIIDVLPDSYASEDGSACIDGVVQGIRLFGNNTKEVFYYNAKEIPKIASEQGDILDSLYLEIEKTIES